MIEGGFVNGKLVLPVRFCVEENPDLSINFVVDTGFNGELALPLRAIAAMQLTFLSEIFIRLADGSGSMINTYIAKIVWDGQEKNVRVLEIEIKPLLGATLLNGFRLTAEFVDDGVVQAERI
jgi:clan AA aspartic protease